MEEFDCLPRNYFGVPLAGELRVTTIVWRSGNGPFATVF